MTKWLPHIDDARFETLLPYRAYDPDTQVFVNSQSIMTVLEGPLLTGANEILTKSFTQAFNALTLPGLIVTVRRVTHPRVEDRLHAIMTDLAKGGGMLGEIALREKAYYQRACREGFLLPGGERKAMLDSRIFLELSVPCGASTQATLMDKLVSLRQSLVYHFRHDGLTLHTIDAPAFLALMRHHFSQDATQQFNNQMNPDDELNTQCIHAINAYEETPDAWLVQHKLDQQAPRALATLAVTEFPQAFHLTQGADLLALLEKGNGITVPHTASISFALIEDVKAKAKANRKFFGLEKMAHSMMAKLFPKIKDEFAQWQYIRERLVRGKIRLAHASFLVTLHSTPERLLADVKQVQALYNSEQNGFCLSHIHGLQLSLLLANSPALLANTALMSTLKKVGLWRRMTSFNVTTLLPMIGEWKGTRTGMVCPTLRGQLAALDIYQITTDNKNIAVAAATGSGKSVMTQNHIIHVLARGGFVYVIDKGHSYKKLCENLGGVYLSLSSLKLNPFSYLDAVKKLEDRLLQLEVVSQLLMTMAYPNDKSSDVESKLMLKAVQMSYQQQGTDATIQTVCDALADINDQTQLKTGTYDPRLFDLITVLDVYCPGGLHGCYFNEKSDLDPNAKFVVLEIGELDSNEDLQRAVLFSMINAISQRMYLTDRSIKKLCIIDEAWSLLTGSNPQAAQFINKGYRTSRKHGGGFMTIMQTLEDYLKDGIAKACYENSDFKIIMRQNEKVWDSIEQKYPGEFSDYERQVLKTFKRCADTGYSSFMLQAGDVTSFHTLFLEPRMRMLFSTEPTEYERVATLVAQGYTIWQAVEQGAREFFPAEFEEEARCDALAV